MRRFDPLLEGVAVYKQWRKIRTTKKLSHDNLRWLPKDPLLVLANTCAKHTTKFQLSFLTGLRTLLTTMTGVILGRRLSPGR